MYVEHDDTTNDLSLKLPQDLTEYFSDLNNDLLDEYGFEPINKNTLQQMDVYIKNWFADKGIELPEDEANNTKDKIQ